MKTQKAGASDQRVTYSLMACCLIELSVMMDALYICLVLNGSHWACVLTEPWKGGLYEKILNRIKFYYV